MIEPRCFVVIPGGRKRQAVAHIPHPVATDTRTRCGVDYDAVKCTVVEEKPVTAVLCWKCAGVPPVEIDGVKT